MAEESIGVAQSLIDDYAKRSGITGNGDEKRRYLWTDAFALQSLFGLAQITGDDAYREQAIHLIDLVHSHLGRFREDDPREGWISGLPEEEGKNHPTKGGLRIGKDLPERKAGETYDAQLEWGRDGQYYHYLTKWISALLVAQRETGEEKYAHWAAELAEVSERFIVKKVGRKRMYWKMSTDLTRPLVDSMGAQDALEGAILCRKVLNAYPHPSGTLMAAIADMDEMCNGKDWSTNDPLGLGGLLLNTARVSGFDKKDLPASIHADKLFKGALHGLQMYKAGNPMQKEAFERLAFRECGLSLGLRVMEGLPENSALNVKDLQVFFPLAEKIETFWAHPQYQKVHTWTEHLDINAISLASSLIAGHYPKAFYLEKTGPGAL